MPTIKGTASVSDDHAMAKQLKQTKFPETFSKKVKLAKVNVPVMSQWIEKQVASILGFEDEIVASTASNLFLEPQDGMDPRKAQLNLVGFLGEEAAAAFAANLWELLLDAQEQSSGIPTKLLEEKKAEMQKQREEEERQRQQQQKDQQQQQQQRSRDGRQLQAVPEPGYRSRDYRRDHSRRDYDRRPVPPPPPPPAGYTRSRPRPVSPVHRPGVDEFGRVAQHDEDDRKPQASDETHDRRHGRRHRESYVDNNRRDRIYYRDDSYRGRSNRDREDRRRYDRGHHDDRDDYRRRRFEEEEEDRRRRRRSRSRSWSSSNSRSGSRSRSSSYSRSRSPSSSRSRSRS